MRTGTCGRCGFKIATATALKSRFTHSIYCPDIDECDRRHRNELTLAEMTTLNGNMLKGLDV